MNHFESPDFNAGMIFARVEKVLAPALRDTSIHHIERVVSLPVIQVFSKGFPLGSDPGSADAVCSRVVDHFDDLFGKQFTLEFTNVKCEKQYVEFHYRITRKEQYREMTVAEIEAALGYKIKVVGDIR